MARPRKTGLDYFPHDVDASEDEKIEALRALYGNDGYAFYFILLERIYRSDNAELDISKKAILAALVKKIGISEQKFFEMLNTAFDIELFNKQLYEQNNVITSKGIKKRFEEVESMRERWRKKKKNKEENKEDTSNIFSGENSEETGESKVKQSKVKESKINNNIKNINMQNDEIVKISEVFENYGYGTVNFGVSQTLSDFVNDYGYEWTKEALYEGMLQGKKTLKYVLAILQRWKAEGGINHGSKNAIENNTVKTLTEQLKERYGDVIGGGG